MLKIQEDIISPQTEVLVERFFDSTEEKYILGCNKNAQNLSIIVNIAGFIDDFTLEKEYCGKPIYRSCDVKNKEAIIVSSSLAIYPKTAINNLKNNGFYNILSVLDISLFRKFNLFFLSDARRDIIENFEKYNEIFNLFVDDESRVIFKNILNFRYNLRLSYLENFIVDLQGQYFEYFLNLKENEVFIDVGGFDGATSIEFIKHCPNYKSIYIFEPAGNNLDKARENLKYYKNINFFKKGLSNKKDTYSFNSNLGSASIISSFGNQIIEVDTLDNLVEEQVSFIKIDIEGWESMAIEGMTGHILNDHPKLAISVYHKVDDFWKIPKQILDIRSDYKLYIRHYTEGMDETVMFFIPSKV